MKIKQNSTSATRHLSVSAVFWAEKAFQKSSLTKTRFSAQLAERKDLSHLLKRPHVNMPVSEYERISHSNLKKIQRYLNFETRMPADILPAWADCLPSPYCDYLRSEIYDSFYPASIRDEKVSRCIKALAGAISTLIGGRKHEKNKALHDAQESIKAVMGDV